MRIVSESVRRILSHHGRTVLSLAVGGTTQIPSQYYWLKKGIINLHNNTEINDDTLHWVTELMNNITVKLGKGRTNE